MYFDVHAALAEIERRAPSPAPAPCRNVADVAGGGARIQKAQPPAPDAEILLGLLRRDGPRSYGAAASALGWGAGRAWQADARLRAAGLIRYDEFGRACPVE